MIIAINSFLEIMKFQGIEQAQKWTWTGQDRRQLLKGELLRSLFCHLRGQWNLRDRKWNNQSGTPNWSGWSGLFLFYDWLLLRRKSIIFVKCCWITLESKSIGQKNPKQNLRIMIKLTFFRPIISIMLQSIVKNIETNKDFFRFKTFIILNQKGIDITLPIKKDEVSITIRYF